jgi:hypothetical protein
MIWIILTGFLTLCGERINHHLGMKMDVPRAVTVKFDSHLVC